MSYTLELARWGVSNTVIDYNDQTLATNNSNGINLAIAWANQQGYTEVIFPRGTYLISEKIPVEPKSFMTLNLGGSTLRIRNNGLAKYSVICYKQNQIFSRVTNGIIQGDRYNHNYTTPGEATTHEWGTGVLVPNTSNPAIGEGNNIRFLAIDNVEFLDLTGDGVSLFSTQGLLYPVVPFTFESGSINKDNGTPLVDSTRIRMTSFIDLTRSEIVRYGYFGIYGDVTYNSLGSEIVENPFDVIFYKADGTFHSSRQYVNYFDEILVPSGANKAKLVLRQAMVPAPANCKITLRVITLPKYVYIESCHIHHCRRLGVALQGAKWVYVRECEIHDISGTGPAAALDVEDNFSLNQDLYIEKNHIYDNPLGIILVDGKNFHITGNRIERCIGLTVYKDVRKVFIDDNYFIGANLGQLDGDFVLTNNHFHYSNVTVRAGFKDSMASIDNCHFHNSALTINRDHPYTVTVSNCRIYVSNDYNSTAGILAFGIRPQIMKGCTIEGLVPQRLYSGDTNATDGWIISECAFVNTGTANSLITTLPLGTYENCKFMNTGKMDMMSGSAYHNCRFEWAGYTLLYSNGKSYLKIDNCYFKCNDSSLLFFTNSNAWGRFEFLNNRIEYLNSTTTGDILQFFRTAYAADAFIIKNNKFISNKAMKAINSNGLYEKVNFKIEENEFDTVTYNLGDDQIMKNNYLNGVLDPYTAASSIPANGYYKKGDIIQNTNLSPGGYIGWVCTTEGYAKNYPTWTASTSFSAYTKIFVNGHVYVANNSGKSGTIAPIWPITSGSTVNDNEIVWKELGVKAVFKQYGAIQM